MKIVADNLHEMSSLNVSEKKKKMSAAVVISTFRVKWYFFSDALKTDREKKSIDNARKCDLLHVHPVNSDQPMHPCHQGRLRSV